MNDTTLSIIRKIGFKLLIYYNKYCVIFKRALKGREYIPKMKHPDDQWLGHQCKNKKYMKLFCIFAMDILQGNYLSIDYVRNTFHCNCIVIYSSKIMNLIIEFRFLQNVLGSTLIKCASFITLHHCIHLSNIFCVIISDNRLLHLCILSFNLKTGIIRGGDDSYIIAELNLTFNESIMS